MSNALPLYEGPGGLPGMSAPLETYENQLWFGDVTRLLETTVRVDGTARDAGHTGQTTFLRPGLLMGTVAATNKLKEWNPVATDGTSRISHVLTSFLGVQRAGVDTDLFYRALRFGDLKAGGLIVPGSATPGFVGTTYEYLIADQLLGAGFRLDSQKYVEGFDSYRAYATSVTAAIADIHARTVTNIGAGGATTLTIPAAVPGARFRAVAAVNQDFTLACGAAGLSSGSANVLLAELGDSADLVGTVVLAAPLTVKWNVVAHNGAAFS